MCLRVGVGVGRPEYLSDRPQPRGVLKIFNMVLVLIWPKYYLRERSRRAGREVGTLSLPQPPIQTPVLKQGPAANISVKGHRVNIFGFAGSVIHVATVLLKSAFIKQKKPQTTHKWIFVFVF